MLGRLIPLALQRHRPRQALMGLGGLGLNKHGLAEVVDCPLQLTPHSESNTQIIVGLRIERIEFRGAPEVINRRLQLTPQGQSQARVVITVRIAGLELQGSPKPADRLLQLPPLSKGLPQARARGGSASRKPNG